MLQTVFVITIGFSVVSSLILLGCYSLLYKRWNKSWTSIASASVLLLAFIVIQLLHLINYQNAAVLYDSKYYSSLIILTAPAMYLFLTEYVLVEFKPTAATLIHLLPLLLNFTVSNRWTIPAAFLLGAIYASVSLYRIYQLRNQRQRFKFEAFATLFILCSATTISLLAALAIFITPLGFILGYGFLIGMSYVFVVTTLLLNPDVATNLNEAAETRYAKTTLAQIDRKAKLGNLQRLVADDKIQRDETLNLAGLSTALSLSTHQLSELINSEYGYGFSHFVRRCRVEDAKEQLIAEPDASILSISLASGFTSQSTFYAAFNEICGETPGNYRKMMNQRSKSD